MEYPVDINTIAYWPMDDAQNEQSTVALMGQALASTGLVDDFTANENGTLTTGNTARAIFLGQPAALIFERNQPFTISAWVFPINNSHIIFSTRSSFFSTASNEKGLEFSISSTGTLQLRLTNSGGVNEMTAAATGSLIPNGTEKHLVVTYDGSSLRAGVSFYVNGINQSTTSGSPNVNNLSASIISGFDLYIGRNPASSGQSYLYSNAAIRHVSVWNRILTAGEVSSIYSGGTPPDLLSLSFAANLLAWWKIQKSDNFLISNGILDSANVGPFHGTAVGTAKTIGWTSASSSVAATFYPRIAGGPRLALDLGQDNCRWFDKMNDLNTGGTSSNMESGSSPQSSIGGRFLPHVLQCVYGTAWTIEGWVYVNRAPSATGVYDTVATSMVILQYGNQNNLITLQINTSNQLQATWVATSLRTATANTTIPIQQWCHIAVIGVISGPNRNIQFYISGTDAGLVTGLLATTPFDTANRWTFAGDTGGGSNRADQYWGGMAYFRLSNKARSLSEIQAAALDPINITVDNNTVAFWGFQENPHMIDRSPNGNHLVQRSVMDGVNPSAPVDSYAAQGPAPNFKSHLFANSLSNTAVDSPMRQSVAQMFCDTNEYTIECFFHPENNLNASRDLYFAGGNSNHTSDTDNLVLQWTFLTNRLFQVLLEAEQRLTPSDDSPSVITLAENLRQRFNSHRTNLPGGYHSTIDSTNITTSVNGNPPTTLLNEIKADFNAHIASTAFHGVADVTNTITSANATNLATCITLANEIQQKFHLHGINSGGNYHQSLDAHIVSTGSGIANATYKWFARTANPAFALSSNQGKELGIWYGFALKKRDAGNLNFWKLDESSTSTQSISMGNQLAHSFERVTPFTLMIWVNCLPSAVGTPRIQHIIGKSDNSANPVGYSMFFAADGKLTFRMGNGGAAVGDFVQVSTNTFSPGQLTGTETCIAVTYDGTGSAASGAGASGVKIYLNGTRATNNTPTGTTLNTGSAITSSPFTIGLRNLVDQPLGGYIREASVWNRELTSTEILEAFGSSGRPPPDLLATSMASALIGYWKFDQSDTGATVIDHSNNSLNGTPQGGLTPTSKAVSLWDLYVNGQPLETIGPLPNSLVGNIFVCGRDFGTDNAYFLSPKNNSGATFKERRAQVRLSNVARSDEDILKFYNNVVRTTSVTYKMRATDDAAPSPGYVYWIAPFPDFAATLINTSTPPLVGSIVPGSVIQLTSWDS